MISVYKIQFVTFALVALSLVATSRSGSQDIKSPYFSIAIPNSMCIALILNGAPDASDYVVREGDCEGPVLFHIIVMPEELRMEWPTRRQIRETKSVVRGVEIVDTVRHDDERDLYSRERVFLDIDGFSVHFHYLDVEHSVAKRIDPIIDAALPRQPEKKRP